MNLIMKTLIDELAKTKIDFDAIAFCEYKPDEKVSGKKVYDLNNFSKSLRDFDKSFSGLIQEFLQNEEFDFTLGSILTIKLSSQNKVSPKYKSIKKIFIVGLGEKTKTKSNRKGIFDLVKRAKSEKVEKLAVKYPENSDLVIETAILASYEFTKYKTKDESAKKTAKAEAKKLSEIRVLVDNLAQADKKSVKNSQTIAEATCLARDLVWEPACEVTPTYLANEAKKLDGKVIKVTVKEASECKKLGMGSFLAVAQGSDQPPKFIELSYKPTGKIKKHIGLIGKGVTFDSGGLSLKPAKAMEMMKEDMAGAAAIIGIMTAVNKIQPANIQITAIIAATENMPSGKAYKPGDVITAMNGKTIEVNNTDAEGRLTLADAITYLSQKFPDEIVDFATLTGACTVALGNICAGLMGNDQELIERIKASAARQGELFWQLPLYAEYKEKLKSPIADLINAGSGGQAGAQNGALFIQEFVGNQKDSEKQIPWAHLDIAGPCWLDAENEWSPKGASGIPVRTIMDYLLTANNS